MKRIFAVALMPFVFGISAQAKPVKALSAGNPTTVVLADSTVSTTLNLPQALSVAGRIYEIKKVNDNFDAITIDAFDSELIEGATTTTVNTKGENLRLMSDGNKWHVLSRVANTEWASFTPGFLAENGSPSNYTANGKWRRVGDSIEIEGIFEFSDASAFFSSVLSTLPSGLTVDENKLSSAALDRPIVGIMKVLDAGAQHAMTGAVYYRNTTSVYLQPAAVELSGSGTTPTFGRILTDTFPITIGASDSISFNYKLPIASWK